MIYYKNFLPIKLIDVKYWHESLNFELRIGATICKILSLYRSPSQKKDNFKIIFGRVCDHMAEKNPFVMVVHRDFNSS